MLSLFENIYREHDVIPINVLSLPFWIFETVRAQRSMRAPAKLSTITKTQFWSMVNPNLNNPIFLVGAPRSGTTFLGACLSQIPEVSYFFEPVLTKAAVRVVYDEEWNERRAAYLYRSVYSWLMRLQLEPELRFCEKTPGNCFIIPFLHRTFPGAKFVHIMRDGRDSAFSLEEKVWYRNGVQLHGLRDPDGYRFGSERRFWVEADRVEEYEHTSNSHRCIWLWRRYVEEALKGSDAIPKERVHNIRYEDLLNSPVDNAEKILSFLEIDKLESRAKFVKAICSNARRDSIGRWKSRATGMEVYTFHSEAGRLLSTLGYE